MAIPRIEEFAFPTVAQIRKGTIKRPNQPGADLKDRMRVVFYPGCEEYKKLFQEAYSDVIVDPQNLYVSRIDAMFPTTKVWDSLQIYNEAHQAGRMVLRANDKQVITRRDPLTGKYLVRDGEPFEAFVPGEPITYERDGQRYSLNTRTTVRLKLFLYKIARMVTFEFKSTSFYDSVNLRQQLGAIQLVADMINNGIAGGIPFVIYRKAQEVCWNKKDGSAARVPHYIINAEINADWVGAATRRMTNFALTGQQIAGLFAPPVIEGNEDPEQEEEEEEENEHLTHARQTATTAQFREEEVVQPHPPIDPPVADRTAPEPVIPTYTGKMSYEMACTVKSTSTGEFYKDLDIKSLVVRLNQKLKIRPVERSDQIKFEIDVIKSNSRIPQCQRHQTLNRFGGRLGSASPSRRNLWNSQCITSNPTKRVASKWRACPMLNWRRSWRKFAWRGQPFRPIATTQTRIWSRLTWLMTAAYVGAAGPC